MSYIKYLFKIIKLYFSSENEIFIIRISVIKDVKKLRKTHGEGSSYIFDSL